MAILRRGGTVMLAMLCAAILTGVSPTPAKSVSPTPKVAAVNQPVVGSTEFAEGPAVINFLSQVIGWYRHLTVEERVVDEPSESLFVADDRQMANEVLSLSFEFAKAQASLLAKLTASSGPHKPTAQLPSEISTNLQARGAEADAEVKQAQDQIKALQQKLATARRREREAIDSQIAALQGRLDLAEARAEAIHSMLRFEGGGLHTENGTSASGLAGQIEELEKSVPEAERAPKTTAASIGAQRPQRNGGLIDIVETLFWLNRKSGMLNSTIELTDTLKLAVENLRAPLIADLRDIDHRGDVLAAATATDVVSLRQRKAEFDALIDRHKLVSAAAIPLSKEAVILALYTSNLGRWKVAVQRRTSLELHRLIVRLIVLGVLLAIIFAAAALWRRFVFSYVHDVRRRHQFLQARRIVLAIVIALVLIFNFATEIGALATVMGFAAAGIAVALQNVILSVAGYFFLIGKFGIKVGDRVQISGVTGDVIDIGLVKLSLMELAGNGTENDREPTGRVVVFSNAVVFQPSGNFFKQIPGTHFVWNEVSLILAPNCDYRLAEKRLLDAVDEVFSRYRDSIQRQYREMARSLNMAVESPKPQSRINLGQNGIEIEIRYPAETRNAIQTADEISRRILDAISREPTLTLVGHVAPNIQAVAVSEPSNGAQAAK